MTISLARRFRRVRLFVLGHVRTVEKGDLFVPGARSLVVFPHRLPDRFPDFLVDLRGRRWRRRIEPAQTRGVLTMTLRNTLSKRETRPPKKHGNIPL